ncbi:MAG: hypothetical protein AAF530_21815 [Pseudomonadota bacterium]
MAKGYFGKGYDPTYRVAEGTTSVWTVRNAKMFQYEYGDFKVSYMGKFALDANGFITGGRLHQIEITLKGKLYSNVEGITVDAYKFFSHFDRGNVEANDKLIFRGDDDMSGSRHNDALFAHKGDDLLFGGKGDDFLSGGDGDDRIDGGSGADRMEGGRGNDLYIVQHKDDLVVETLKGAGGIDTVLSIKSHTLSKNVENLTLQGKASLSGRGNELDNEIIGNTASNRLQGFDGDDLLIGGKGNDLLKGGAGNDILRGGTGGDILDGGEGADRLIGGNGDDLYRVHKAEDRVIEREDGGIDTVESIGSYRLGKNIENLTLKTGSSFDGRGNGLDNHIIGTSDRNKIVGRDGDDRLDGRGGDDRLVGGSGDDYLDGGRAGDTLIGGDGDDTLTGGRGADTFVFEQDDGRDVITDFLRGADVLDVSDFGFDDAAEVLALANDNGERTVIDLSETSQIVLRNTVLDDLDETMIVV